jgi:hypothetical protein
MWEVNIVRLIRAIIGDMDCGAPGHTYDDSRILSLAVIAAYNVYARVSFENVYTINIGTNTVSPDSFALDDKPFNILTAYKAASILLNSEVKAQAACSFSMKDGPSSLSMSGMGKELQAAAKLMADMYAEMEDDYKRSKSLEGMQAIISPYYSGSYLVENYDIIERNGDTTRCQ